MEGKTTNPQELFLRANKEYKQSHFQKAKQLYESIEHKGRAVLYNLGNCCYQLKQYPQAVALWRQAQNGAPASELEDIRININRAREREGFSEIKQSMWARMLRACSALLPLIVIQIFFLLAWYALLWLFIIRKGSFGIQQMLMVAGLVCVIVWLGMLLWIEYQDTRYARAVTKQSTAVYAGPHDRYHEVGKLSFPDELKIIEQRTGWCKIMHDNTYGWVPVYTIIQT